MSNAPVGQTSRSHDHKRLCRCSLHARLKEAQQGGLVLQGDVMVAEDLSRLLGPRLVACFLHEVKSVLSTVAHLRNQKSNQASWLAAWRDRKIYMHRSHLGMAVQVSMQNRLVSVHSFLFWGPPKHVHMGQPPL